MTDETPTPEVREPSAEDIQGVDDNTLWEMIDHAIGAVPPNRPYTSGPAATARRALAARLKGLREEEDAPSTRPSNTLRDAALLTVGRLLGAREDIPNLDPDAVRTLTDWAEQLHGAVAKEDADA